MPRLMAMTHTEPAVRDRTKTVTRRTGWAHLREGERLTLCRKVRGREPGEPLVRLAEVEVVSVRRERLSAMPADDVAREGFGPMAVDEFLAVFRRTNRLPAGADPEVTRIEWRYLDT